ncbi:MAG: hypothetical protein V3S15_03125 [Woeseiaceae bacterium]
MRPSRIFILLALTPSAAAADNSVGNPLVVHPQAAIAEVPEQPAGRRLVMMPALEFEFSVAAQCEAGAHPEAVSISVADTQTVYRVDGSDSHALFEIKLRIPRPQLAPLAIEEFCTGGEYDAGKAQTLLIRAALTAQVSLLCSRENGPYMHFMAVPLDIRLICESAADVTEGLPQDASGDSF